jgi:hypothetical protein
MAQKLALSLAQTRRESRVLTWHSPCVTPRMRRFFAGGRWLIGAGLLLVVGCAGHASGGPDGGAGTPGAGGGAPAGGAPAALGGSPGAAGEANSSCVGSIDELQQLSGDECPTAWCPAQDRASDCNSLPSTVSGTSTVECAGARAIEIEHSNGDVTTCYYMNQSFGLASPDLMGLVLSSKTRRFCGGNSTRIASSNVPQACDGPATVWCAGTTRDPTAKPASPSCFNNFSSSCSTCCPVQTPDCSVEQPSVASCTPADNSFCSCGCFSGKWQCFC